MNDLTNRLLKHFEKYRHGTFDTRALALFFEVHEETIRDCLHTLKDKGFITLEIIENWSVAKK